MVLCFSIWLFSSPTSSVIWCRKNSPTREEFVWLGQKWQQKVSPCCVPCWRLGEDYKVCCTLILEMMLHWCFSINVCEIRFGDVVCNLMTLLGCWFYTECLGMKLLRKRDIPEDRYSNAFLGYGPEESNFTVELTYSEFQTWMPLLSA